VTRSTTSPTAGSVSQAAAAGVDAEPIGRVGGTAIVIKESAVVALDTLREGA
jgi:hypothetical protein